MDPIPCRFCGEATKLEVDYDDGPQNPFPGYRVICRTCGGIGPADDGLSGVSRDQAIANWNRRPTSTLVPLSRTTAPPIEFMDDLPAVGELLPDNVLTVDNLVEIMIAENGGPADDLAAAREKRDLAGLPSVDTHADPDGVSMDFDLGGDKPRKR